MRELKFRAWDKINEIMCEIERITFDEEGEITFIDIWNREHGYQESQDIIFFEIIQYTGLKAKKQKYIWAGSIVKNELGDIGYVDYLIEAGSYIVNYTNRHCKDQIRLTKGIADELEVIGDIFRNKNLIDQTGYSGYISFFDD